MLTPAGTSLESNRFHQWFSTNLSSDVYKFRFFSRTFILMHPGLGDGGVYHAYCYVWSLSVTRVLFLFFFLYTGKAEASGSMHVTLCDYIMPWDSLSTTQKKSLSQRYQMGCDCKVRQQRAAFACAVYLVAWRKKRQLFTSSTTHPDIAEQTRRGMIQGNKHKSSKCNLNTCSRD